MAYHICAMKTPDISVIIPAYNAAPFIGQCLDSILYQDGAADFEIIVVDDGSTDDTKQIVQDYGYTNHNIKLITQKNSGVSVARNNAMSCAHGHFISFVDADDMVGLSYYKILPYFISACYPQLCARSDKTHENLLITLMYFMPSYDIKHIKPIFDTQYFAHLLAPLQMRNTDISLGGKVTIDIDKRGLLRHIYETDRVYGTSPTDKQILLNHADVRESANFALYRREFLIQNKLSFLEQMDLDEDMLFIQQAVLRARNVATVPDATYLYNRHAGTLSNMNASRLLRAHKFDLAQIQQYSMILNELQAHQEYATIYSATVKKFADLKHQMHFYTNCTPADTCTTCKSPTCDKCAQHKINTELIAHNISDFITNMR